MSGDGQPVPVRLADLVGDVDDFARHHWGTCPRLQRAAGDPGTGTGPVDLARLLTIDDIDRWLSSSPRRPTVRLVREGTVLDPATYCTSVRLGGQAVTDVIDPAKVTAAYLEGATVVFQSLHRTWRPVGELVAQLTDELSHPVQANAYLTPPGAQGLAAHEDRHDVLVVQTHGLKWWTVAGLGELALRAGDVLYLPAGTTHQAATGDGPSLHLTLGIIPETVRSAVRRVLDRAPGLDRRLPLGYRRRPPGGAGTALAPVLARALDDAGRALAATDPEALADELLLRAPAPTVPETGLGAVVAAATLGLDARLVCRHPADTTVIAAGEGQLLLRYRGGVLRMPEDLGPALALVLTGCPIALRDLPGLDDASRLVVARRLAAEGVVAVVG